MKWIFLASAIICEVAASLSLKAALNDPAFLVIVAAGCIASCAFLAGVLRTGLAFGVAYGIWAALGVTFTVLLAAAIFREPLTPTMLIGVSLVIGGVLCVELGSHEQPQKQAAA
ncbi:QacE family quaternary ammonium compound efflux SMR transporter [Arthrobacter sp. CDRTa11]|uniref:DMT family transporter n=1 Tax=Arthrobacter sp. CDRTa11 TaxID=2651199 RepID=UPI002265EBFF|nr:SMR family transporter [Arthrobacter sp. CDRTa11]UZX02896.1 QacE family quaternary ammonium compound efflux SMR transporter [Arthrobacter sp. CDRTa11]